MSIQTVMKCAKSVSIYLSYLILPVFISVFSFSAGAKIYPREYYLKLNKSQLQVLLLKDVAPKTVLAKDFDNGGLFFTDQDNEILANFSLMTGKAHIARDPQLQYTTTLNGKNPLLGFAGKLLTNVGATWETWFVRESEFRRHNMQKFKLISPSGKFLAIYDSPEEYFPADDSVLAMDSMGELKWISHKNGKSFNVEALGKPVKIGIYNNHYQMSVTENGRSLFAVADNKIVWIPMTGKEKVLYDDKKVMADPSRWLLHPKGFFTVDHMPKALNDPKAPKKVIHFHSVDAIGNITKDKVIYRSEESDKFTLDIESVRLEKISNGNPAYYYVTHEGTLINAAQFRMKRKPLTQGDISTLSKYGVNMLKAVKRRQSDYEPAYGRSPMINKILSDLTSQSDSGVILSGPDGIGKRTFARGIAYRLAHQDRVFKYFNHTQMWEIRENMLYDAPDSYEAFKDILNAARNKNVILWMDDFHLLNEYSDALKRALKMAVENGEVLWLGSTTPGGLKDLEEDRSFLNAFKERSLKEPSSDVLSFIISMARLKLNEKYIVAIEDGAIRQIIWASQQQFPNMAQPGSALKLLKEIAREYSKWIHPELGHVQSVTLAMVNKYLNNNYRIIPEEKFKALAKNLIEELNKQIIGQLDAKIALESQFVVISQNMGNPDRPYGSFLFLGPTGVGKTETSKALSKIFQMNLIQMEMKTFAMEDLTREIKKAPNSIVLLEDIHKASPRALDYLLSILEEGYAIDPETGEKANFRKSLIILTTNHGHKIILDNPTVPANLILGQLEDVLTNKDDNDVVAIPPEVWGRFDEKVVFRGLTRKEIFGVGEILIKKLQKRMAKKHQLKICVATSLKEQVSHMGYDENLGARPLRKVIEHNITRAIANQYAQSSIEVKDSNSKYFGMKIHTMLVFDDASAHVRVISNLNRKFDTVLKQLFQDQQCL